VRGGAERRALDRPPAQASTPSHRAAAGLEPGRGWVFLDTRVYGDFFFLIGHGFGLFPLLM
jgi:hypothetical protein